MIFLDNASTTRVCPNVMDIVKDVSEVDFYNPSALYGEALKVQNLLAEARKIVSGRLGCMQEEIFFTSCATESNNWAFENGIKNKNGNIVVSMGEHASVYECAMRKKYKGLEVRFAKLKSDGSVDIEDLLSKVDQNTCFVSIIHCSNETGAINDLKTIVPMIKAINPKIIVHSDGVQALAKISNKVKELGVDLYSMSAHKIGGLKGCGALYIRKGVNLMPFIVGGGQEYGLRSGTENVPGICAFGAALEYYGEHFKDDVLKDMRSYMIDRLVPIGAIINGTSENSNCILSLSIFGIKAEILQHMLSDKGILIGLGSACSSKSRNNRVLSAIGRTLKEVEGSIRISFDLNNNMEQIIFATEIIIQEISKLRGNM